MGTYRESEDHRPNPTDIVAQLDTTGLGGPDTLHHVTPIFAQTARQDLLDASDALAAGEGPGPARVILPDDPDQARKATYRLHSKANGVRAEGEGAEGGAKIGLADAFDATKRLPEWEQQNRPISSIVGGAVLATIGTSTTASSTSTAAVTSASASEPEVVPVSAPSQTEVAATALEELSGTQSAEEDSGGAEVPDGAYDPSTGTVAAVRAHMDSSDEDEVERVREAERRGQNRKGIVEYQPGE